MFEEHFAAVMRFGNIASVYLVDQHLAGFG
jgi:hypothetical protein